jgi:hypothetical protein
VAYILQDDQRSQSSFAVYMNRQKESEFGQVWFGQLAQSFIEASWDVGGIRENGPPAVISVEVSVGS